MGPQTENLALIMFMAPGVWLEEQPSGHEVRSVGQEQGALVQAKWPPSPRDQ